MSLLEHAKSEIELLKRYYESDKDGDDYDGMLDECLLSIVELIAAQGHSGGSIGTLAYRLDRLLKFKPLTALSGNDDEWLDVGSGMFQNKRMSSIFKNNVKAYDIDNNSISEIKFPYYPI